jgi:hypothetical protein
MNEQNEHRNRPPITATPDPIIIDTEGHILQGATPLAHPPVVINTVTRETTSALVPITDVPELETVYTTSLPARIKDAFVDGEAIILIGAVIVAGVGIATLVAFVEWVQSSIQTLIDGLHFVEAHSAVIIGDCALALLAILAVLYVLQGGGKDAGTVVVKGCPRGPTPGAIRIQKM